jgi:methylthioribose-1-phosphate isomerase
MKVEGKPYRTIWLEPDGWSVGIIDQTRLPHRFERARLQTLEDAAHAIQAMLVRGAPLIGVAAAYGLALALRRDPGDAALEQAGARLLATRPTAVNLRWAIEDLRRRLKPLPPAERAAAAYARAGAMADEDVAINRAIGTHGLALIRAAQAKKRGGTVNLLTHCNAGWLAAVDWGTALAPVYRAQEAGLPVHVWVDETRPRNQGAFLTAWELQAAGVPHTVIVDNAGGHLMQRGEVDLCFVGTDRTTAIGDVANKIGTYLKALAAHDNGVPFYVCLPSPTIDWSLSDGFAIEIEARAGHEVSHIAGATDDGALATVRLTPDGSPVANPAFDVTPARLITGLVTERGVCVASAEGLLRLFPERRGAAE